MNDDIVGGVLSEDRALHPTYRWHTFDRRLSWHKFKIFYSQGRNQRALLWFAASIVVLPVAYSYFVTSARTLFGFAVVAALMLITVHGLRAGVKNVWRFWKTAGMNNPPPPTRTEDTTGMDDVQYGHNPVAVVDRQVALNARVMLNDRTTTPQRVYACAGFGSFGGQFLQIAPPGHEVSILYLDVILARARANDEGAVQSLVVTDIHELAHWALAPKENQRLGEHSPQWNEVIGREVNYVMDDKNRGIPTGPSEPRSRTDSLTRHGG